MSQLNDPGALQRLWWRSTRGGRLGIACSSVVLSLIATGLAVNNTPTRPPEKVARSTFGATPRPGDPAVTVHAVSAVDLFNGLDVTTGALVRVHVPGIRLTSPCWAGEALAFARKTLEGKKVWLLTDDSGARDPEGRLLAGVLLPTGKDYAEVAMAAGAGLADAGSDGRLTAAEAQARQHHRGVWATSCAPSPSESSQPSPSSTTARTTESSSATVHPTTPTTAPSQPTVTTTTTPKPRPPDDVQRGVKAGAPCSPEGARGVTTKGQDVRCKHKGQDLRWLKEDG